jgi:hypothetical protein
MARVSLVVGVLVSVILIGGGAFSASADTRRKIVMFYNPPTQDVVNQLVGAGITVLYDLWLINALAVQVPPPPIVGPDLALVLLDALIQQGIVQQVSNDVLTFIDPICPTSAPPSVSEYRWGMQQIGVPATHQQWPQPNQTAAVTVAVLDTGIASHLELSARTVQGYNAFTGTDQTPDGHGHGTAMAEIIMAKMNGQGVVGVAGVEPKITVAPVKVLDDTGAGYLSGVIKGLEWVLNNGIPLANMSFGFSFSKESDGTPLRKAIQSLSQTDIIIVASAGNRCQADGGGDDGGGDGNCRGGPASSCPAPLTAITAPAAYPGVLAVGATDIDGQITAYSLSGPQLAVVAPGGAPENGAPDNGQILSTDAGGLYGRGHGTGHAAAHVTGAVALALALEPGLTSPQVRNLVTQTAVAGRIDVNKMMEALLP